MCEERMHPLAQNPRGVPRLDACPGRHTALRHLQLSDGKLSTIVRKGCEPSRTGSASDNEVLVVTWCSGVWLPPDAKMGPWRPTASVLREGPASRGLGKAFLEPQRPRSHRPATPSTFWAHFVRNPQLGAGFDPSCTKCAKIQAETPWDIRHFGLIRKTPPIWA